jgi:hypothetical protein
MALTGLLYIRPLRLTVWNFRQPLVDVGVFQVAELRSSPHQLTSSRSSPGVEPRNGIGLGLRYRTMADAASQEEFGTAASATIVRW